MNKNEIWLNNERKQLNKRINNIIEVLHTIPNIKADLNYIIDTESDNDLVNTAKYLNYWLEKDDTIDDPEITKYNNYEEVGK